MTQVVPNSALAGPFQQGMAMLGAGRLEEAQRLAVAFLAANPEQAAAQVLLGVVRARLGDREGALACFGEATILAPGSHDGWFYRGMLAVQMNRADEARECLRRATILNPRSAEAWSALGDLAFRKENWAEANTAFARAAALAPDDLRLRNRHLCSAYNMRDFVAAEAIADEVLARHPDERLFRRFRARIFSRTGRIPQALPDYKRLLAEMPEDVETLKELGNLHLYTLGDMVQGTAYLKELARLRPDDIGTRNDLIWGTLNTREGDEAAHISGAHGLATALLGEDRDLLEAAGALQTTFLRTGDYAALARMEERTGGMAKVLDHWVRSMLVGSLHGQLSRVRTEADRRLFLAAHRAWGAKVTRQAAALPIKRAPRRSAPDRRIRLGLMSSDLRGHAVGRFTLPLAEHFDRAGFHITAYSFSAAPPDEMQKRFAERLDAFRVMPGRGNRDVAQAIADDQIDILIELGGSTHLNMVEVLAWRPAPVQISWLGYPHSAGLAEIDHIIVDPYLRPTDDTLLLEKPLQLAESWVACTAPGFDAVPIEGGLPSDRNGYITFGTMNNPVKYSAALIGRWAGAMKAVPGSRFLFVRPEGGSAIFRGNIQREFARHGVDPERILFEAVRGAHMPHYNRMDIALDTGPQTGGTTTCDALWMGVPTISLVGPAMFERLSYSNLSNAGLGDLCAFKEEDFAGIAAGLADDRPRLREIRQGLIRQPGAFPLGNGERWVRNLEVALLGLKAP